MIHILACTFYPTILACTKSNHLFQRDAKFVLIEQLTKKYNIIEELRLILKKRENF